MSSKDYDSIIKFISGGSAAIFAKSVIAPIDRVKFLFMGTIRDFNLSNLHKELRRIYSEEGIRSFWKGNLAQAIRVFPASGTVISIQQFAVYHYFENVFSPWFPDSIYAYTFVKFMSGSAAGALAVLFTYPFDVMRTRLAYQTTGKLYNGIFHGFYTMLVKEGPSSFFKGIVPTTIGAAIYEGIRFSIFFTLENTSKDARNIAIFAFGSIAGLVGQIISYPFDVVRKRMLAQGFIEKVSAYQSSAQGEKPSSMMSYFKMIWKYEGVKGLLKGITLNFVKAPIMLGTIHLANHLINKALEENY